MAINYTPLEKYLMRVGAQEREIRKVFTLLSSPIHERKMALEQLNILTIHVQSITFGVELLTGEKGKNAYYWQFYNQARSARGVNPENRPTNFSANFEESENEPSAE